MTLTMRPTGLSSGIDQDREDYTVFCGERIAGSYGEVRPCSVLCGDPFGGTFAPIELRVVSHPLVAFSALLVGAEIGILVA
jgi:hypothetical protein